LLIIKPGNIAYRYVHHLAKNPASADAALYYVMYSPLQDNNYCANLLFEIYRESKQGNPEQQ